jgi:hypothetical protein
MAKAEPTIGIRKSREKPGGQPSAKVAYELFRLGAIYKSFGEYLQKFEPVLQDARHWEC